MRCQAGQSSDGSHGNRQIQIRQNVERWQNNARTAGLIIPSQRADPQRSQASTGVSIDWLRQFSDSLKELPLLPTETYAVVRDVVTFCTMQQGCRLVDVIPQDHVGYPTYYICHNWNCDFHAMVNALVNDFNRRWQAHLHYKCSKDRDRRYSGPGDREPEDTMTAALAADRKKLAGYYVWVDIAAINQHVRNPLDPASISRLITVIGRTVLILDQGATALTRLWCCYELWLTVKAQRTILTIRLQNEAYDDEGGGHDDDERQHQDPEEVAEKLPQPDLTTARASMPTDKAAILASLQQDIASSKIKAKSLEQIAREVRQALMVATVRELEKPEQLRRVYAALTQCCRVYTDLEVQPGFAEVDAVRKALRDVIEGHYHKESLRAKLMRQEDPELETWECLNFLDKEFQQQREDDFLVQDVKRFGKLTMHSYATRFSSGYVNSLMRQAGTCDDIGKLSQYVHQQCRIKSVDKGSSGP